MAWPVPNPTGDAWQPFCSYALFPQVDWNFVFVGCFEVRGQ